MAREGEHVASGATVELTESAVRDDGSRATLLSNSRSEGGESRTTDPLAPKGAVALCRPLS